MNQLFENASEVVSLDKTWAMFVVSLFRVQVCNRFYVCRFDVYDAFHCLDNQVVAFDSEQSAENHAWTAAVDFHLVAYQIIQTAVAARLMLTTMMPIAVVIIVPIHHKKNPSKRLIDNPSN
ncbi:hypothetical protein D3C84_1006140 [compost metagenome]